MLVLLGNMLLAFLSRSSHPFRSLNPDPRLAVGAVGSDAHDSKYFNSSWYHRSALSRFSAAEWHRRRRRLIISDHPEVLSLLEDDSRVLLLGLGILPVYAAALWHSPSATWGELAADVWGIGSIRASWAVYCSHAISHGRWRHIGPHGGIVFNFVLAVVNLGTVFGILPSYWIFHNTHHTQLGALPVQEARERAQHGQGTDGDLGIAHRFYSPPSRKYFVSSNWQGEFLPRVNEFRFQDCHQLLWSVTRCVACSIPF